MVPSMVDQLRFNINSNYTRTHFVREHDRRATGAAANVEHQCILQIDAPNDLSHLLRSTGRQEARTPDEVQAVDEFIGVMSHGVSAPSTSVRLPRLLRQLASIRSLSVVLHSTGEVVSVASSVDHRTRVEGKADGGLSIAPHFDRRPRPSQSALTGSFSVRDVAFWVVVASFRI